MSNRTKTTLKRKKATNNQLVKANNALKILKPSITMDDKRDFCKRTKLSLWITNKYLRGDGPSLTTATKALVFFQNKVARREQQLSKCL